jgi:hypothetical protein
VGGSGIVSAVLAKVGYAAACLAGGSRLVKCDSVPLGVNHLCVSGIGSRNVSGRNIGVELDTSVCSSVIVGSSALDGISSGTDYSLTRSSRIDRPTSARTGRLLRYRIGQCREQGRHCPGGDVEVVIVVAGGR